MIRKKNIVLTGKLHCGKSTLVRNVLETLSIKFSGIFVEPIKEGTTIVGYGVRLTGRNEVMPFAHRDLKGSKQFNFFYVDLAPFERAAAFIQQHINRPDILFVIDEIGIIEDGVDAYQKALQKLLDSSVPTLFVIQKRSSFLQKIKHRHDVVVYELENNHLTIEQSIGELIKKV